MLWDSLEPPIQLGSSGVMYIPCWVWDEPSVEHKVVFNVIYQFSPTRYGTPHGKVDFKEDKLSPYITKQVPSTNLVVGKEMW